MRTEDVIIRDLEEQWDINGFLGQIRDGVFQFDGSITLIELLKRIETDDLYINKRIVSLVWFIPIFMEWNRERVLSRGTSEVEYNRAVNSIQCVIQSILGAP